MGYVFRGKETADIPFSEDEIRARIERTRELDRRFIAATEAREFLEPLPLDIPRFVKAGDCGTNYGYITHVINKTEIDDACREAHTIYHRQYRRAQKAAAK